MRHIDAYTSEGKPARYKVSIQVEVTVEVTDGREALPAALKLIPDVPEIECIAGEVRKVSE